MPRKKKPKPIEVVNPPVETLTPPPVPQPARSPTPTIPEAPPRIIVPKVTVDDLRSIFGELASRKIEALNLYEPLPIAQAFHASRAPERIVRGSNRAGKTLATHVELARALLDRDPHKKYPLKNGRAFLVGYRGQELGEVNYRKLFRSGAFKILRDPRTGQWRTYRQWDPNDLEFAHLARPAPPLIPDRYLATDIAWESKRENIPKLATFTTGWELNFFSSLGKPPTGSDIDLAVFDEEIEDPDWYPEISARLVDRNGLFIWGATPQAGTEQLYDLCYQASNLRGTDNPRVVEYFMQLADNPHMSEKAKAELRAKFSDPLQYQIRVEGEFAIVSFRFYPEFHKTVHGIAGFPVPSEWTRYAIIDPGHQVCSVLFVATPPKGSQYDGHRIGYKQLVIPNCNALMFGREMARVGSQEQFQAFIIDRRGSQSAETGSGLTIEAQYATALKQNGIRSVSTGAGFLWGSDNFEAGTSSVRSWLQIRPESGRPTFLYMRDACFVLEQQMELYRYAKTGKTITEKPIKKNDHLVDCLRYAAAHGCPYVKPKPPEKRKNYVIEALERKRARAAQGRGGEFTNLGPGK